MVILLREGLLDWKHNNNDDNMNNINVINCYENRSFNGTE